MQGWLHLGYNARQALHDITFLSYWTQSASPISATCLSVDCQCSNVTCGSCANVTCGDLSCPAERECISLSLAFLFSILSFLLGCTTHRACFSRSTGPGSVTQHFALQQKQETFHPTAGSSQQLAIVPTVPSSLQPPLKKAVTPSSKHGSVT